MKAIRFLLSILGVFALTLLLPGRAAAQSSFDKAISLNPGGGTQHVAVPSAVWLNGSFTVEAWVYVRDTLSYARLMDFGNGAGTNVVYCALSQDTSGRPTFGGYNQPNGGDMGFVTAPSSLLTNTWTHLAFTCGGGTGKIFVNGVEVASGPMTVPVGVVRNNNFIGGSNWPDPYANAIFDEFRLWNTARTQEQIQASRFASLAGDEAGLQLYYRFDSDSEAINYAINSATSTGSAFNGALIGAPAWVNSTAPAYIVTNTTDTDPGSLRETITTAPAGSTITFSPALSGQTITLSSELLIDKDLNIDAGSLAGGLTLDGGPGTNRHFRILAGNNVNFFRLRLSGGDGGGGEVDDIGHGGSIRNEGNLTLRECTLSGNTSPTFGGAIFNQVSGTLSLERCTLSGNLGTYGGGAIQQVSLNPVTLNNCTVANNTVLGGSSNPFVILAEAGGINAPFGRPVILSHCTVSGNVVTAAGGNGVGGVRGDGLTVSNSIITGNTDPNSPGIQNITPGFTVPVGTSNLTDGDAMLAPLGNYGGPTRTMPPLPGSPAIDAAGTTDPGGTDQRGLPRFVNGALDIGAVESGNPIPALLVNTAVDENDGLGVGGISLRDAIAFAPSGSTITFAPALSGETILLTSGTLMLDKNLTINGSFLPVSIDIQNSNGRMFQVNVGAVVFLDSLTLSNGNCPSAGGAILNLGGNLTVSRCTLSDNSAWDDGGGGAIFNDSGSSLTLNQSTLTRNHADEQGGAIYNHASATLTVTGCTISGNTSDGAPSFRGGLGGGGIFNSGLLSLNNSIVAGNADPDAPNISGPFGGNDNFIGGDPLLAPLGHYGGPTETMALLPGSLAIDAAGTTDPGGTDQRGLPRFVNGALDIGAVESGNAIPGFLVNTAADENDGLGVGGISLRDAIAFAPGGSTITFAPALSGQTITLTGGQIVLDKNLTIDATSLAGGITLSGNDASRVFEVNASRTVLLNGLAITHGRAVDGGGIRSEGDLTLNRCTLTGNVATSAGGGGILNWEGSLTVNQSTLTGNTANGGGAIATVRGLLFQLDHCTLTGNTTTGSYPDGLGGDVFNYVTPQANLNSIVSDLFLNQGGLLLVGANIIETYGEWGNPTPVNPAPITSPPLLAPLGNYGGPTQTMPPLNGSPAIDAAGATAFTTDQRGFPFPVDGDENGSAIADIGAAEAFPFTAPPLVDSDSDGIDDRIEPAYPQFTVGVDDSALDTDGDGSTDAEELRNMTDPGDGSDYFRILSFVPAAGFDPVTNPLFDITFSTFPGLDYSLEGSQSLAGFEYIAGTGVTASGFSQQMQVLLDSGRSFVRASRGRPSWATSVIGFSSEFSSTFWSANRALGAPDTYPEHGDIITAWASLEEDEPLEFLELGFSDPQPAGKVSIYETYNPGAVSKVSVRNSTTGVWVEVWTGIAAPAPAVARVFTVTFPETAFPVDAVRIELDSAAVPGWNEIDAVSISR